LFYQEYKTFSDKIKQRNKPDIVTCTIVLKQSQMFILQGSCIIVYTNRSCVVNVFNVMNHENKVK